MKNVSMGDKQLLYGDCKTDHHDNENCYVVAAVWDTLPPAKKGGINVSNTVLWRRGDIIGLEKFDKQAQFIRAKKNGLRLWCTRYQSMNDVYFNLKTGFWYLRRKHFKFKTPAYKKRSLVNKGILRNPFKYLDAIEMSFGWQSRGDLKEQLAHALGVHQEVKSITDVVFYWFAKHHGIKYSDNWRLHIRHYPLMSFMRKCGMNMTKAILNREGIDCKLTNKLLNHRDGPHEELDLEVGDVGYTWNGYDPTWVIFWYKFLGDLFPQFSVGQLRIVDATRLDGGGNASPWFMEEADPQLTRQEKLRLVRCSHHVPTHELTDHLRMHNRLNEAGLPVVWTANNREQFQVEHEAWSELQGRTRRVHKQLDFQPEMVDLIEDHDYEGWRAVLLTSSHMYEEEGQYQRHCVGGYVDSSNRSFIVSLRHSDGTRITNEVDYYGRVMASRGRRNVEPRTKPEWDGVMHEFIKWLVHMTAEYFNPLPKPEVKLLPSIEIEAYLKEHGLQVA
jgi:hypothetical protein